MKNNIGVIGKSVYAQSNVEIFDDNTFVVNGVRYFAKKKPNTVKTPEPLMIPLLSLPTNINRTFETWDGRDVILEYQLIQKKQSKLSRAKREWVVNRFHKHFEEVPELMETI